MKVLLLEDDAAVRTAVARVLRSNKLEVVEACSCSEAREVECSLGVFDVDLPDGDGVDLARELISAGKLRAVVFYTGTPTERASDVGPVVAKGTLSAVLLATVARTLTGLSTPRTR